MDSETIIPFQELRAIANRNYFYEGNEPLTVGSIPFGKTIVGFGKRFNQKIEKGIFPSTVIKIFFSKDYNQPIGQHVLPSGLKILKFGKHFNQPIGQHVLPSGLKILMFEKHFNQPIGQHVLPEGLTDLTFGKHYNQRIGSSILPDQLTSIHLGEHFDQPINNIPTNINSFVLKNISYSHSTDILYCCANLVDIRIGGTSGHFFNQIIINMHNLKQKMRYQDLVGYCIRTLDGTNDQYA